MKKILSLFVFALIFMGAFLFSATNVKAYTHISTLRLGINSSQVLSLQQALNNAGFIIASSGAGSVGNETTYFGTRTKIAVIAFQKSKGLVADGIVGTKTGVALASSIVSHYPDGCTSDVGFSKTTGMSCSEGLDMGLIIPTCPNYPTVAPLSPTIQIISPNGGESLKTGETYEVKWLACTTPDDSWVKLTYTFNYNSNAYVGTGTNLLPYQSGTIDCIASSIPASTGEYDWKIKNTIQACGDALMMVPDAMIFSSKIKAELYTGAPTCDGSMLADDPCVTGTRTLHASDESNSNFTISN